LGCKAGSSPRLAVGRSSDSEDDGYYSI